LLHIREITYPDSEQIPTLTDFRGYPQSDKFWDIISDQVTIVFFHLISNLLFINDPLLQRTSLSKPQIHTGNATCFSKQIDRTVPSELGHHIGWWVKFNFSGSYNISIYKEYVRKFGKMAEIV
jgi:hypothetical protein